MTNKELISKALAGRMLTCADKIASLISFARNDVNTY